MTFPASRAENFPERTSGSFNPLKPVKAMLTAVKDETDDVKTFTVRVNGDFSKQLRPGQFNMLGYPGIVEAPISFSSLKENGEIEHTIRSVGLATRFIDRMSRGEEILIRGPYGRGWPMKAAKGRDLLVVAGGVGLAPLRPVINEVIRQRNDFGEVFLLYGSRNEKNLLFKDEYKTWEKTFSLRITVDELVARTAWKYNVGVITGLLDALKLNVERTVAFVCGPEMMMRFVCRGLLLKDMPASDIYVSLERRMRCGIAQCGHCQHVGLFVCKDGPVFSYREVAGLYD